MAPRFNPSIKTGSSDREVVTDEEMEELRKKGLDIWLPYPVSANRLHMTAMNAGVMLTKEARLYYARVKDEVYRNGVKVKFTGRLCVTVEVYDPDCRRRDINNYTKSLFDALEQAGIYADDEQIDETHIYRRETRRGGAVRVRIKEISNAPERKPAAVLEKEQAELKKEQDRASILKRYGAEAIEQTRLFGGPKNGKQEE